MGHQDHLLDEEAILGHVQDCGQELIIQHTATTRALDHREHRRRVQSMALAEGLQHTFYLLNILRVGLGPLEPMFAVGVRLLKIITARVEERI